MIAVNRNVEKAARAFFNAILPEYEWGHTDHKAKPLILSAFLLYKLDWNGRWDIRRWKWPFDELEKGGAFEGDEPWTILLRRAVEIAREKRHAQVS